MVGSSSDFPMPILFGENFRDWSKKMKGYLISEGLWHLVEEGYENRNPAEILTTEHMQELRQERVSDAKALSLIHHFLSPNIFTRVFYAKTAKEAWETLQTIFKMNEQQCVSEDRLHIERMNEHKYISEHGPFIEPMRNFGTFDLEGDEVTLSGDKPFFDVILMKSAVRPLCHLNFPVRVNSMLPSINLLANLRCLGKTYEVFFYGQRKQKGFGAGWRQFVDEYDLDEDDAIVFEVMECNDSKLELKVQILRCTLPPELEEKIRKRKAETKVINEDNADDDRDDYDDEDYINEE
ncbi:hypothetical protein BUALT_Bualt01G0180100 [Buddleja alternifolia]|uniref:TF-B3 domain-containing protein n=1 Tax=Buddleja alternifolia TaxID=168488 RepID=A0AAV6Y938_9LAMI|nr:hypothetical protein BUALT_Bualt01G0180100 [Buddleja alternifolia]